MTDPAETENVIAAVLGNGARRSEPRAKILGGAQVIGRALVRAVA